MDMKLPIAFDQDRRACFHRRGRGHLQRLSHATKGCQVVQLVDGGKDYRKLIAFRAGQRFRWPDPDALTGFQLIVRGLLLNWRGSDKEMSIKALGHALWRDP